MRDDREPRLTLRARSSSTTSDATSSRRPTKTGLCILSLTSCTPPQIPESRSRGGLGPRRAARGGAGQARRHRDVHVIQAGLAARRRGERGGELRDHAITSRMTGRQPPRPAPPTPAAQLMNSPAPGFTTPYCPLWSRPLSNNGTASGDSGLKTAGLPPLAVQMWGVGAPKKGPGFLWPFSVRVSSSVRAGAGSGSAPLRGAPSVRGSFACAASSISRKAARTTPCQTLRPFTRRRARRGR